MPPPTPASSPPPPYPPPRGSAVPDPSGDQPDRPVQVAPGELGIGHQGGPAGDRVRDMGGDVVDADRSEGLGDDREPAVG